MPPKKEGRKASSTYNYAADLTSGEVLTDFLKQQWKVGKEIAKGGFGKIYSVVPLSGKFNGSGAYVVKVEPAENGPLFSEIHVYQRIGKKDELERWRNEQGLRFLGVPPFIAAGLNARSKHKFRFLIMPHYGSDIEKIRVRNGGTLSISEVFGLGVTCIDILHYLHDHEYIHADVKAENLLLHSPSSTDVSRSVLVDFGLARRISGDVVYKEMPRKAHDGTLIFTSIDAHKGVVPTYRTDVEILGYNLIYWLTGSLPWFNSQDNPNRVADLKQRLKDNIWVELEKCIDSSLPYFIVVEQFLEYAFALEYMQRPDYAMLKDLLQNAVSDAAAGRNKIGKSAKTVSASNYLQQSASQKGRKRRARVVVDDNDGDDEDIISDSCDSRASPKNDQSSSSTSSRDLFMQSKSYLKRTENRKVLNNAVNVQYDVNNENKPGPSHKKDNNELISPSKFAQPTLRCKIPGLANMKSKHTSRYCNDNQNASDELENGIITPLSNTVLRPKAASRKSMSFEASLVKKYMRQSIAANRPKKFKKEKAENKQCNFTESGTQTSPDMWRPRRLM